MNPYFTQKALEETFGLRLSRRFLRFLESERLAFGGKRASIPTYGGLIEVHFDGEAIESFINEDWPEFDGIGLPYGHPSATEFDFEEHPGWVPLATLGEEEIQFLLCKADEESCKVVMWEHETGELEPVSCSLDDFLSKLQE